MPRPNKDRHLLAERHLAHRIGVERDMRGWTYEGLANRMTGAGCKIAASALYKIEKGVPPRKITVDELVALSQVFNLPVTNLLSDASVPLPERAKYLVEQAETQHVLSQVMADLSRYFGHAAAESATELRELVADDPAAALQAEAFEETVMSGRLLRTRELKEAVQSTLERLTPDFGQEA